MKKFADYLIFSRKCVESFIVEDVFCDGLSKSVWDKNRSLNIRILYLLDKNSVAFVKELQRVLKKKYSIVVWSFVWSEGCIK